MKTSKKVMFRIIKANLRLRFLSNKKAREITFSDFFFLSLKL